MEPIAHNDDPHFSPSPNARQKYLDTLHWFFDPFATPVAEQELQDGSKEPRLFSYIVDLIDPTYNKPVSQLLLDAQNGFVFGALGSGKTTLKYILEEKYRNPQQNTLAVTYELSDKFERPPIPEEHWRGLAENLAVDLFIQIIERIDNFHHISDIQKEVLTQQMGLVWPQLQRTVKRILREDLSNTQNGVATLWTKHNRYPVRYIYPSSKINQLLSSCRPSPDQTPSAEISGLALLQQGIAAAKTWGFKSISVFVDGVDAGQPEPRKMLDILTPLLENLEMWQRHNLFFYFFFTDNLLPYIDQKMFERLTHPPARVNIEWSKDVLLNMLHQRLWVAGYEQKSLNALARLSSEPDLETRLCQASRFNPRRLLEITAALFDAHAVQHSSQIYITDDDWLLMEKRWEDIFSTPLLPKGTSHVSPCKEIFPDYHPDRFVNRSNELTDVSNWLNTNNPDNYIKIITAPPLFGKTWFIAHLCHTLDGIQFTPLIFLPENLQTEEKISDILTQALHTNECDGMHYGSLSGRLVALRECINNHNKRLLLLLDFNLLGPGDTKTPKALKEFLAQFPTINESAKIIIATRHGKVAERHWRRQFKIFPQVLELPRLLGINSLDCNKLGLRNEYCEYAIKVATKVAKSNIDEWGSREVSEILATGERDASDVINIWKTAGVLEPGTATGTHKFVDGWRDVFRDSEEGLTNE